MRARNQRWPGSDLGMLPAVAFAALLLIVIVLADALRWPNLLVHDTLALVTVPRAGAAQVVLVETPDTLFRTQQADIPLLVEKLHAAGATHIVLLAPVSGLDPAIAGQLAADPALSWGRPLRLQRDGAGAWHAEPAPVPDAGIAAPPTTEFGIARGLPMAVRTDAGERESVVARVARALGHAVPADRLWINFNNGREPIPRVTAGQVLSGALPSMLLRGHVAVIGLPLEEYAAGIATPRSGDTGPASPAEFQALALDTLLDDAGIRFVNGFAAVALVLTVFLLHVVLFQLASVLAGAALGFSTLLAAGIAAVLVLGYGRLCLPVAEIALAIVAAYALVHLYRAQREKREITDLHARLRNKISARRLVAGFHETDEPWQKLIALVNQHLTLKRSIFLETVPGDHRVREIASLNCGIDDIGERRRDFQRTPYSTALATGAPIELEKPYFVTRDAAEREFMAPLTFGGEVLGFWAFTVVPGDHWNREQFLLNTNAFARQIGEILWQRQSWRERNARAGELPQRLLTAEVRGMGFGELRQSLATIENRLDTLEDIFNGMSSAAVLYDLFGQVIQGNARMEELARRAGLRLYDLPAIDMLRAVSGCSDEEARARLRHVVVQQQPIELAATIAGVEGTWLLRLRTLHHDLADARIHEGPRQPFELLGVLMELVDISATRESLALARDLGEHVLRQVGRAVTEESDRDRLAALVRDAATLVDQSLQPVRSIALPLDAGRLMRRVLARMGSRLADARVAVDTDLPPDMPLVFGDVVQLERLFEDAAELLLADAPAGTRIVAGAGARSGALVVTLAGSGFGIPQDKVDAVFSDRSAPSMSTPLGRLRGARDRLRENGDDLQVFSAPGEGFRVEVTLRPFHLGDRVL